MKRMIGRINTIIEHADDRNVRVMVDAEQTYFQTAISRLAIEMQRVIRIGNLTRIGHHIGVDFNSKSLARTNHSKPCFFFIQIFNKDRPLVFNTYQCYRRDTRDNVKEDIALSEKENFHFACKVSEFLKSYSDD